jgi:hypothetical protein
MRNEITGIESETADLSLVPSPDVFVGRGIG